MPRGSRGTRTTPALTDLWSCDFVLVRSNSGCILVPAGNRAMHLGSTGSGCRGSLNPWPSPVPVCDTDLKSMIVWPWKLRMSDNLRSGNSIGTSFKNKAMYTYYPSVKPPKCWWPSGRTKRKFYPRGSGFRCPQVSVVHKANQMIKIRHQK